MVFHKFGSAVVATSTTLFISAFVGVATVGVYSNYILITGTLLLIVSQAIVAAAPGVGDLHASSEAEASREAFDRIFFINFVIMLISTTVVAVVLNPFIDVWIGQKYELDRVSVGLIVLNYFLYGMRQTSITFINACGLFWAIRYKSLAEAGVSVISSLVFLVVLDMGVAGALLSVTVSTISTNIWWEPWVVWRRVFGASPRPYFRTFTGYTLTTLLATGASILLCGRFGLAGWQLLFVDGIIGLAVGLLSLLVLFGRSRNMKYVVSLGLGLGRFKPENPSGIA
jgi:O-antigen/teichoic acid export membrane protein